MKKRTIKQGAGPFAGVIIFSMPYGIQQQQQMHRFRVPVVMDIFLRCIIYPIKLVDNAGPRQIISFFSA